MSMERARELVGFEGSYQRYPNVESVRDFADISDPESLEDESAGSLREWIGNHSRQAAAYSLLGMVALLVIVYFAGQYIPLIVGNRYVQGGALLVTVFLIGRVVGWRANQSRIEDIDEMAFQIRGGDLLIAKGVVQAGGRHRPPLAIPIKGYRKPGMRPRPYTIEEIDPQILDRVPGSVEPDTPAMIRMHGTYASLTDSVTGQRAVQMTDGFEPVEDPTVHEDGVVVLRATKPSLADEEEVREINALNEELATEKRRLKAEKKELEQRVDSLLTEVTEPMDERVDKELERVRETLRASRGQARRRDGTGEQVFKDPRRNGTDEAREDVEREVGADAE